MMLASLWIGHDDCRTTTMGCVYRDWKPTHTVIQFATQRGEWRIMWERGKPWTVWMEHERGWERELRIDAEIKKSMDGWL